MSQVHRAPSRRSEPGWGSPARRNRAPWLAAGAAGVIALVLTDNRVVLDPLARLSPVGGAVLLAALSPSLVLPAARRANQALSWTGAVVPG